MSQEPPSSARPLRVRRPPARYSLVPDQALRLARSNSSIISDTVRQEGSTSLTPQEDASPEHNSSPLPQEQLSQLAIPLPPSVGQPPIVFTLDQETALADEKRKIAFLRYHIELRAEAERLNLQLATTLPQAAPALPTYNRSLNALEGMRDRGSASSLPIASERGRGESKSMPLAVTRGNRDKANGCLRAAYEYRRREYKVPLLR